MLGCAAVLGSVAVLCCVAVLAMLGYAGSATCARLCHSLIPMLGTAGHCWTCVYKEPCILGRFPSFSLLGFPLIPLSLSSQYHISSPPSLSHIFPVPCVAQESPLLNLCWSVTLSKDKCCPDRRLKLSLPTLHSIHL